MKKVTTYRGFDILRDASANYRIRKPNGNIWDDVAASIATAKKWIDFALCQFYKN